MSLDLTKTTQHIDVLITRLKNFHRNKTESLKDIVNIARTLPGTDVIRKMESVKGRPYLCAGLVDGLSDSYDPGEIPENFQVISTDGSHIDVDRHISVACALINIGVCALKYGKEPGAYLSSYPIIYSDDELYLNNQGSGPNEISIEGPILGLKRTIEEVKALEDLIEKGPEMFPTLAILDGSLILWSLSGRGYPPVVRNEIIDKGLLPTLDRLQELARDRTLAIISYVSLPRNREVVNSIRSYLCETQKDECEAVCSNRRSQFEPCSKANDILDRDLFQELLKPGQRSSLFYSNSSLMKEYYAQHRIFFYYINTGDEIARIEMPQWVAMDRKLQSFIHTIILDQCQRGIGYPIALSEAHNQAVISGVDRQRFKELTGLALTQEGLPMYTSEKSRSKRMAWL